MVKLSVVVITLNEEKNLKRCLQSVKDIADEILVVDSFSKDNTVAIAEQFGAKVITQSFLGFGAQKNFATEQAAHHWVLSLDADEALSPELCQSILDVKENPVYPAYRLSRLTNYCGKWIRHCGWYPDKKVRLYNKTKGNWQGERIHEHWELYDANEQIGNLTGDLLHYSYYSISDHISQIEKFTEMSAKEAAEQGKDCSVMKIWFVPKWNFFKDFILKLGVLDGYYGYLVCKFSAYASMIKYNKIRQYAALKKRGMSI